MIATICGAYRNAGDHLIGDRARALLRAFVDSDIVTVDRLAIGEDHYELFNRARAVMLCGGPAYQREIYPKVYPIERERVRAPIVPFGLGWKSAAGDAPETFRFAPQALEFIRGVHERIELSSARDPLTVEVLERNGIDNALMTGCPAWYDLNFIDKPYRFTGEPGTIVYSMPAAMQPGTWELLLWLTQRFPRARRIVSFHHGVIPATNKKGCQKAARFLRFCAAAMLRGWKISSLAGSLPKLEALYGAADLHVGYRVHAHLFCLSRRISSILINEDIRGVGQAKALGARNLVVSDGDIEPFKAEIEAHFDTRGEGIARSEQVMRDTFSTMQRFLKTL